MTTYQDIRSSRKLIWAGIAIGYGIAVATAIVSTVAGDGPSLTALALMTVLAIPPTLALFSLDRRPSLLTAASMSAVVLGVLLLPIAFFGIISAILWGFAVQRRPRSTTTPRWATWGRPLLAAVVVLPVLVLFVHLDPRCTVTAADGTKISTTVDETAPSGWSFQMSSSGSSSTSSDGVTSSCTSDTQQPWESALSVFTSLAILWGVFALWPKADREAADLLEPGDTLPANDHHV